MSPSTSRARALTAAGALSLVAPLAALPTVATAQQPATAAAAPQPAVTAKLADGHIRYRSVAVVSGRIASGATGTPVTLEYRPRGGQWGAIARAATKDGGRFRLTARLAGNGALRVVTASGDGAAVAAASGPSTMASRELGITVAASLRATKVRRDVVAGRSASVRGRVLPARAGRVVRLQVRHEHGWRTVDRDRTSKGGAYALRWRPSGIGHHAVRVRVGGDARTTSARRSLGAVKVYRRVFVSWYGPGFYGHRTACGQTLGYGTLGVAHKSLPCGTKLTLRNKGRSVTVRVIDRGPYVGGREYDLTGATKRALGFGSTGTILSTR